MRLILCTFCGHGGTGLCHKKDALQQLAYSDRLDEWFHPSCLVGIIENDVEPDWESATDWSPLYRLLGFDRIEKEYNTYVTERNERIHRLAKEGRERLAYLKGHTALGNDHHGEGRARGLSDSLRLEQSLAMAFRAVVRGPWTRDGSV